MSRLDLLERIDRRLSDMRARISPHEFEDCATSILTSLYPGLVPIVGGTDYGIDAEITTLDLRPIGLIITSSRTLDGAQASLRSSLTSIKQHGLPVRHVMVANLAEMNRRRRSSMGRIAEGLGFELVQVFDRAFFANQFREHPDWRLKILGIAGGAFCLSREPRGGRPDDRLLPSVGRDELLEELMGAEQDAVLCGVPGSGKSHVAARVPGVLFLEDSPAAERLLDDLIAASPEVVVVDDVGGRLDELDRLIYARRTENIDFRIVVTCWPHQLDAVTDHLPEAQRFDVGLLTREEMGVLLRARGITRLSVLVQILAQAQGRPAWALNLADLLVRGGDWKSLWTGTAVRTQITGYLRRSGASPIAIELLAAIALLGEVNEGQVRRLGRLLEVPRVDLSRTIQSVAVAGLLDVTRVPVRRAQTRSHDGALEDRYKVEPRVVAASIVADSYFAGRASVVSLDELHNEFPERREQVLQAQIHCALLGAKEPVVPTMDEIAEALALPHSPDHDGELLRSYAAVGPDQALFVVALVMARVRTSWGAGDLRATERDTRVLAELVAALIRLGGLPEPVHEFLHLLAELAQDGFAYAKVLSTMVEELRGAHSGDAPQVEDLARLAETIAIMPESRAGGTFTSLWLALVVEILAPTFEGNYMSPERLHQFVLQSFTWSGPDLTALFTALSSTLDDVVSAIDENDVAALLATMNRFVELAEGHPLPFGAEPTTDQMQAASRVAHQLASALGPVIHRAGLRAQFNSIARPLRVQLDEPDTLFAVLTVERDIQEDWKEAANRADEELSTALQPYLHLSPNALMSWISANDADLQTTPEGRRAAWRLMRKVADQPDISEWLSTAMQHGLGPHAALLIDTAVRRRDLDPSMVAIVLDDPACRPALVSAVMRHEIDVTVEEMVLARLTVDDLSGIDISMAVQHAPEPKLRRLFTHPDASIRGTAAALWAAAVTLDPTTEDAPTPIPSWRTAIADFRVPSVLDDYHVGQALKVLAGTQPDIYVDLLAAHAQAATSRSTFREWSDSIRELSLERRHRLWSRVASTHNARELFWATAAGSTEWIVAAFERGTVQIEPERLLHAGRCQNGPGIPFEELARTFMALGVEPDGLLWLLDTGTQWGADHEKYAKNLERCRTLGTSDNPDLARLGSRGVELYEPRLVQARQRAKNDAIRGVRS